MLKILHLFLILFISLKSYAQTVNLTEIKYQESNYDNVIFLINKDYQINSIIIESNKKSYTISIDGLNIYRHEGREYLHFIYNDKEFKFNEELYQNLNDNNFTIKLNDQIVFKNQNSVIQQKPEVSDNKTLNNDNPNVGSPVNLDSEIQIKYKIERGDNILFDVKELLAKNNTTEVNEILKFYNLSIDKVKSPFLKHLSVGDGVMQENSPSQHLSNIPKTDVTNFATGMARFLAERAKQELNESFFDVMRKQMEKLPELQYFFPATYDHLYQMNANLKTLNMTVLRERFKEDVNALPHNIYQTTMNVDAYGGKNLEFLRTFNNYLKSNRNGQFINLGLNAVLGSNTGLNPKDLFYNFVHGNGALSKLERELAVDSMSNKEALNLLNSIKLAELISNSLLSPDPERYWVTSKEINDLFTNDKLFKTYIGLLLAKSQFSAYDIKFNGQPLKEHIEGVYTNGTEVNKDLSQLINLVKLLYNSFNQVDQAIIAVRTSDKSEVVDYSYNLFTVFNKSILEISNQVSQNNLIGKGIKVNIEVITKYLAPTVDLAYNIYAKKYSMAINNFAEILGNAGKMDQYEKIAQLVKAETNEQLRAISAYYAENFSKYKDEVNLTISVVKALLPTVLSEQYYDREQLIKLAGDVINTTAIFDPKKEYLYATSEIRSLLVQQFITDENFNVAKSIIDKFLSDKKTRVSLTVEEWVTIFFPGENETIVLKLESLLESKEFRAYLDNSKSYQNFVQKFSKYGTLIGNVAIAQNSDEVKAAIQDAVLPVGSSRIKRYANFSIGLNAFVGGFYGQAYYKENGTTKGMQSFGVTAPIGVSFAFGTKNFLGKHNALGLNLQLIDLGSLVNFYYTKGDGAQLPAGTKIQLGDILAPGATVSYSLFNSPFSIMGGVQYVPNLSRMPEISTNTDFRPLTWRWHVGLTVDIPLFMIKTYTR